MKALCFGSLNIDYTYQVDHFVSRGETLLSGGLQVFSGGKGLNQSIALSRAGVETCHAGSVGEDGRFLLRQLQEAGVDTGCVTVRDDVRTGHAIIQNSPDGDNCILLYGGANQAITRAQVDEVLSHFGEGDVLVLQNEVNELDYIMERAHARGLRIALNPSPMNEKIMSLPLHTVDWLLLNEVEAEQLLGYDVTDGAAAAAQLHEKFPRTAIVLTMGRQGSYYHDGAQALHQSAFPVQAVDTTAAGDTYTGYFLASILENRPVQEAMALGAKAAAISVTRKGAAPSIPLRSEVTL
ncbi:MAG: ribokinase [Ruminococcaceae bacterium]|nr:ribokinase [Oscillospiraceae bacterium]